MRVAAATLSALFFLQGCGGGGGSSPPPPPPTIATLNVTLSPASRDYLVPEDARTTDVTIDATVAGTATTPIQPNIVFNAAHLALKDGITATPSGYRISLRTLANLPPDATGQITFRLCQDVGCSVVYPGSTQTFTYTVKLQLLDWVTTQRNAAQTGYVPLNANSALFSKLWEWNNSRYLAGVSTSSGAVHVTANESTGAGYDVRLYTLNAADGSVAWSYDLGSYHAVSAPATAGGQVLVTTHVDDTAAPLPPIGNTTGHFWCFDRTGPIVRCKHAIQTLSDYASPRFSPTPIGERGLSVTGTTVATLTGVDPSTGALALSVPMGHEMSISQGIAAAADNRAFIYNGLELQVWNISAGNLEFAIPDPFYVPSPAARRYVSTPVIASNGDVLALSGPDDSGSFGLTGITLGRPLVSYDIVSRSVRWKTTEKYKGAAVIANGTVFVTDNDRGKLVALDERTGAMLWTWDVPAPIFNTPFSKSFFMGPALALHNMVLVSTHDRIYAVDTTTHQTVWSYDTPGLMAVTRDGVLVITACYVDPVSRVLVSNGKLIAFRIQ